MTERHAKTYVVAPRYGSTQRFRTLGQAKAWPLGQLEHHRVEYCLKYATDTIDFVRALAADIDAVSDNQLASGPVVVEGVLEPHTGAHVAWTFYKDPT